MKNTVPLTKAKDNKKNDNPLNPLPELLNDSGKTTEPGQQSIITAVQEINKTAVDKNKGYKEGNKNDSDTANVEENK